VPSCASRRGRLTPLEYNTSISCRKLTRATKSCCRHSLTICAINYSCRASELGGLLNFPRYIIYMSNYALFRRSLCLELTSWAYPAINVNSCLQALTKDISTSADIAPSALETTIFYCFIGSISELTYYLLLIINLVDRRRPGLSRCERPPFSSYIDSTLDDTSISWTTLNIHDWLNDWLTDWLSDWLIDWHRWASGSSPVAQEVRRRPVLGGVASSRRRRQHAASHVRRQPSADSRRCTFSVRITASSPFINYRYERKRFPDIFCISRSRRVCCVVYVSVSVWLSDILMSCAKTDEPIEMPFGIWSRVGTTNQALGGGPDPPRIPLGNNAILRCGLSSEFLTICVTDVFVKVTV